MRRYQRCILSRTSIGTMSKLASVAIYDMIGLHPALSQQWACFPNSFHHQTQDQPNSLLPGLQLVWFFFSYMLVQKKNFGKKKAKEGKLHLSHACIKLCKKFNPHRFAALQNCSWVYVANDSLPWQSCIHIGFYHNDTEIDDFLFSSNKEN